MVLRDATTVLRLREVLILLLKVAKLVAVARLEFDCLPAVVAMEMNGIRLDEQRCKPRAAVACGAAHRRPRLLHRASRPLSD